LGTLNFAGEYLTDTIYEIHGFIAGKKIFDTKNLSSKEEKVIGL
jgi:hypothetical protein